MRRLNRLLLAVIVTSFGMSLSAQVLNDDCQFATFIPDVDGYCSGAAEFTNVGAMPDPNVPNICFLDFTNGVWFSFIPKEPAVNVRVFGFGVGGNTMQNPKMALFSGCGDYVTCSPGKSLSADEFVASDLIIGQVYYLMVESATGVEGTFQLCIDDFTPSPSPQSDCDQAVVLCSKDPFAVESLNSQGDNPNEADGSCIGGELASSWYVWECDESGTLTMTLTPSNQGIQEIVDDLDFVIFELPGGVGDCQNRIELLCMGSGANLTPTGATAPVSTWQICNGPTGLIEGETDTQEFGGCQDGSNNFIAPLDMVSGTTYGILINNFQNNGLGFSIEFGGTGTFVGPEADFDVDPQLEFECDKTINFIDLSDPGVDPIVNYTWNFGAGASPSTASGAGPFEVVYSSFGDKVAALTLESQRGCLVTEIVEFFVEPCCQDINTLDVIGSPTDVVCFGDSDGQILSQGIAGNPEYLYSLDGINYQPNPRFLDLSAGEYDLFIVDQKGCMDTTIVPIMQPSETIADAGPDMTVDLGETGFIDANVTSDFDFDFFWSPLDSFVDCTVCLDPEVFPPGTTTYTLTVTDENGCTSTDEMQFLVNIVRPVFWPNIFSADENRVNDFFNIFGGPAVDGIERLQVFDRWGNMMYDGAPQLNSRQDGWDGYFNDRPVNPGVYVWLAQIRFIDSDEQGNKVVLPYSGDVTVLR